MWRSRARRRGSINDGAGNPPLDTRGYGNICAGQGSVLQIRRWPAMPDAQPVATQQAARVVSSGQGVPSAQKSHQLLIRRPISEGALGRQRGQSGLDQGDSDEWSSGTLSEARTTAGRPGPPPTSRLAATRRRPAIVARITPHLAAPRSTRAIRGARPLLADRAEAVPVPGADRRGVRRTGPDAACLPAPLRSAGPPAQRSERRP